MSKALRRIACPVALTLLLTPGLARAASFDLVDLSGASESAVTERTAERGVLDLFWTFITSLWGAEEIGPQLDPNGSPSQSGSGDIGPQLDPNG